MQTHPLPPPPLRLLFHGVLNLNIELNTDRRVIIISIKITFRAGSRSLSFRRSENIILFHHTAVFVSTALAQKTLSHEHHEKCRKSLLKSIIRR